MRHTDNDHGQRMKPAARRQEFLSRLLRAILPLGIIVAGGIVYSILAVEVEEEKSAPEEEQAIRTRITELHVQDYPVVVETNGVVQAHNEVALSAEVSGQ